MKPDNKKGFKITQNYDCITEKEVFTKLLKVLMAYAYSLIGVSSLRLKKSRRELAYDFSMETISKHLENPERFDPCRNSDLVKYLKYNILRRLISNFKKRKSQEFEIGYENDDSIGLKVAKYFVEENNIYDLIDGQNLIKSIQIELNDNPILMELFDLRYLKEYTRKEIYEALNISKGEYANRIRRLATVLNRVLKKQYEQG